MENEVRAKPEQRIAMGCGKEAPMELPDQLAAAGVIEMVVARICGEGVAWIRALPNPVRRV